LLDSIVYFGEKLPVEDLKKAFEQAAQCDLLVCIGSSLTVRPSANVPVLALKNNSKLCIINIQETPFDPAAELKINGFCDPVIA
jgi:NAD-dependent SIR2 family protein deacetylase